MSAQKTQTRKQALDKLLNETHQVAVSQFPDIDKIAPFKDPNKKFFKKLFSKDQTANDVKLKLTQEEYQATLQKLEALIQKPPKNYQDEELLYLEQQLTDFLGFSISASMDKYKIPFIGGVMAAGAHLKRTPTDTLEDHQVILEAGLAKKRGYYGWFAPAQLTEKQTEAERYYISLPIYLTKAWKMNPQKTAKWYKGKKLIVINPALEVAVVGVMADIGPYNLVRTQFQASPEVTRLAKIWHPASKGKVAVFFIEETEKEVPLGQISLRTKITNS